MKYCWAIVWSESYSNPQFQAFWNQINISLVNNKSHPKTRTSVRRSSSKTSFFYFSTESKHYGQHVHHFDLNDRKLLSVGRINQFFVCISRHILLFITRFLSKVTVDRKYRISHPCRGCTHNIVTYYIYNSRVGWQQSPEMQIQF
jgi:hypothetical protein